MKILKNGNYGLLDPILKFNCYRCKCEFVANTSESTLFNSGNNEMDYNYKCPVCNNICCGKLINKGD